MFRCAGRPRVTASAKGWRSLGSLVVNAFEMPPFKRHSDNFVGVNGGQIMRVKPSDTPSAERNSAKFWKWVRAILRKLINRRTLSLAMTIALWIDRFLRVIRRIVGDN